MNKFIHGSNISGQSIVDRALAAKHTVAGQSLAKVICKATTEEIMGPKRKHLDYLLQCTNEPNISIPQMANLLIERTQNASWVVVFKALVTVHNLMNYGNERFTQFLASNNCSFNLSGFTDKSGPQGYDMSAFVRRYSKYLNEKAFSYRQMAFDFCKVKRGKDDGLLRTMDTTKLLKALPVLQSQLDTLIEFDVSANELTNGVINAAFMLMFKDLIRLFACYNDGIINLLEKYFDMNKKNCKEALEIYKKFLARMDRVCEFLKVAENVGIDKGDIPDLAKAPSSLLEALEQHMNSLENTKKGGAVVATKPTAGISAAISNYATASQVGAAPGAGIGITSISDEERQRILEEEQRQLDQMKQQRMKQMAGSPAGSSTSSNTSSKMLASQPATTTCTTTSASATVTTKPMNDPFGSSAATAPTVSSTVANNNKHSHIDDLLSLDNPIDQQQPQHSFFSQQHQQQQPPFIQQSQLQQNLFASNSFMTPTQQHVFMPQATLTMLQTTASTTNSVIPALNPFAPQQAPQQPLLFPHLQSQPWGNVITSSSFVPAFASPLMANSSNAIMNNHAPRTNNAFEEMLKPQTGTLQASANLQDKQPSQSVANLSSKPIAADNFKLIQSDLDSSLASLAGNLNMSPVGQIKKTEHQWTGSTGEKKLTGGAGASVWGQQSFNVANNWAQSGAMNMQPNVPGVVPVYQMGQQRPLGQPNVLWGSTPQLQSTTFLQQSSANQSNDQSNNPFELL